ncbi:MAG: hypothetical protein ABH952_00005 [Candidatus Omnitrophota bacterium]
MKKIYFSKNLGEVEAVCALLKANGYNPYDIQISDHVSVAGADMYYYVQVPENEFESAKDFLKNHGYENIIED